MHKFLFDQTTSGTPQQNGIAEWMNRTLTERARSMRIHACLPKYFWADTVHTTTYLINHGPSSSLNFGIPKEVWSGKEITLLHLCVFGCMSYVHISDHVRDKLDVKSQKCTFTVYGIDEFDYRLWDEQN